MGKVKITQRQYDEVNKLINVALNQDVDENKARSKILETHIQKGWEGTEIKTLGDLSTDEMAKVLFSKDYEVQKEEKLKLQIYEVTFRLNKHTELRNKVSRRNSFKLLDKEVIGLSLNNLSQYKESLGLSKDLVVKCELIESEE